MKECHCSGNNSLRSALGGTRCECGGSLNLAQVLMRIISRLDELDEQDSNLIQGLVAADMGECDRCGEWFKEKDLIRAGDRATCDRCFNWEHFCREEDDEESLNAVIPALMTQIVKGKINRYRQKRYLDLLPHDQDGKLSEPFLTEYRKLTGTGTVERAGALLH